MVWEVTPAGGQRAIGGESGPETEPDSPDVVQGGGPVGGDVDGAGGQDAAGDMQGDSGGDEGGCGCSLSRPASPSDMVWLRPTWSHRRNAKEATVALLRQISEGWLCWS